MPGQQQPFCGGACSPPSKLWIYATIILLCYGFFKEFKPSEAFLTPFLLSQDDGKNFTKHQINDLIYPLWTYSYLVSAVFVFLFTDLARYNPVIIIELISYLATRVLLLWGSTVLSQQLMQVAYGVATATEVGYFSYIYSAVPPEYYERITGPVRAAVLLGRSLSSFTGQILYTSNIVGYYGLNYISMGSVCLSGIFVLLLPWFFKNPCEKKPAQLYVNFHTESEEVTPRSESTHPILVSWINQWKDFKRFYTKPSLIRWSLWWAFGMCGMLQVGNYVQSLWKEINIENHDTDAVAKRYEWNGVVEGATDLLATAAAILASVLKFNWSLWGELTMGGLTFIATILLLVSSYTHIIYVAYTCHILYRSTYAFIITIASSQIAIHVDFESYGLIFGFNTLIALVLEAIMAAIVNSWLELNVRVQFVVYGVYYYLLTVIFVFAGVYKISSTGWLKSCRSCWISSSRARIDSFRDNIAAHYITESASTESSEEEQEEDTDERDHGRGRVQNSLPNVV